jgi:hypothetical protein
MEETRFDKASSPDTIDRLNDDRLRRSEENARGWRRNAMLVLLFFLAVLGYWSFK